MTTLHASSGVFSPRRTNNVGVALSDFDSSRPLPVPVSSVSSSRVGGGVGLSGSTAASRALMGGESARGPGIGSAWSDAKARVFDKQRGREDTTSSLTPRHSPAAVYLARRARERQRTTGHRVLGGLQSHTALGSSASWRFLRDGSDGPPLASLEGGESTVPRPIPLTAEARAYLAAYEAAHAQTTTSTPGFTGLLREQQRRTRDEEERREMRDAHARYQHQHGMIPLEEFIARRHELTAANEQAHAQSPHPLDESKQDFSNSWSPRPPPHTDDDGVPVTSRSSLRSGFLPAVVQQRLRGTPAASNHGSKRGSKRASLEHAAGMSTPGLNAVASAAEEKTTSRVEFMNHLARVDAAMARASLEGGATPNTVDSTARTDGESKSRVHSPGAGFSRPHPPSQAKPPVPPHPSQLRQEQPDVAPSTSKPVSPSPPTTATTHAASIADDESAVLERALAATTEDADTALLRRLEVEAASVAHGAANTVASVAFEADVVADREREAAARRQREHDEELAARVERDRGRGRGHGHGRRRRPASTNSGGSSRDGSDASDASSRSTSRGSSPVILWRATNRVTEALDIPADLRSVFLAEPDEVDEEGEHQDGDEGDEFDATLGSPVSPRRVGLLGRTKRTSAYAPQQLTTLQRIALSRADDFDASRPAMIDLERNLNPRMQAARQRAKAARLAETRRKLAEAGASDAVANILAARPPPPESSFTHHPYVPRVPPRYGAWYLPPRLWVAEASPRFFKSTLSARVNTLKAHMSLGASSGIGVSKHGREVMQVGQAEYEEARTRMGRHGLASWEELQAGALIGSSSTMRDGAAATNAEDDTPDEEEETDDMPRRIIASKVAAAESRSRRRRAAARAKADAYERRRATKKAAIVAKALAHKGIFQKDPAAAAAAAAAAGTTSTGTEVYVADDEPTERLGTNPLSKRAAAAAAAHANAHDSVASQSIEAKVARLREQIPHLQIAQEYKHFVQRSGARMPYYLAGVDCNNAEFLANQRETARLQQAYDEHSHAATRAAQASLAVAAATASVSHEEEDEFTSASHAVSARLPAQSQSQSARGAHSVSGSLARHLAAAGLAHRINLRDHAPTAATGNATGRSDYRFQ